MILGREEILRRVQRDKLIKNFNIMCLQQAGYDLRVDTIYRISGEPFLGVNERRLPQIKEIRDNIVSVKPMEYLLVKTVEEINMPLDLAAIVLPRTTLFRMGISLRTGVVDPGYKGALVFGLKNESKLDIGIERGARIAQIIFMKVEGRTAPYKGRYNGGKIV